MKNSIADTSLAIPVFVIFTQNAPKQETLTDRLHQTWNKSTITKFQDDTTSGISDIMCAQTDGLSGINVVPG